MKVRPLLRLPTTLAPLVGAVLVVTGASAAWSDSSAALFDMAKAGPIQADITNSASTVATALPALVPGDYLYRYRTIRNTSTYAQWMTGAILGTGGLAVPGGLAVAVDICTTPWTQGPASACTGTTTSVLSTTGVSSLPKVTFGSVAPGGTLNVRYTLSLPSTASSALQGKTGSVTTTVTGAIARS